MSKELALLGADTLNQQAGGGSFLDNTAMFTGSAVLSGMAGIYNTFVDYGNKLGGDFDPIDVAAQLESYDKDWFQYYKANQQMIDVTGFVAGSIIPGTLAVKALKAAQGANAAGAIGRAIHGPLNFALSRRDQYLRAGLQEIGQEGGSVFAYINANKLASMAWGAADNVLQAAAFETAVTLTMKESPILADRSGTEILSDMGFSMLVGGTFGGALDAIATQKIFKDAVTKVAAKARQYDTPGYWNNLGLGVGDEIYGVVDGLMGLPTEKLLTTPVTVINTLSKKHEAINLDLKLLLNRTVEDTERDLYNQLHIVMKKVGNANDPEVGESAANMIVGMIKQGRERGLKPDEIKQEVGNLSLGLKSLKTLTEQRTAPLARDDVFYLAHEVDLKKLTGESDSVEGLLNMASSRKPFEKNATAKPYEIIGNVADAKMTANAFSFIEAWNGGYDLAIIGGKLRINPASQIFRQAKEPDLIAQRFLNTRTTGVSDTVVPTWADMLPSGANAASHIVAEGVLDAKSKVLIRLANEAETTDPVLATARHAWASGLTPKQLAGTIVDSRDISKMDRIVQFSKDDLAYYTIRVRDADTGVVQRAADVDLNTMLVDNKIARGKQLFDGAIEEGIEAVNDPRAIAYLLNTTEGWIERALMNGFTKTGDEALTEGLSRPLSDYLQRENFLATWQSPRSLVELGLVDKGTLEAAEAAAKTKGGKYVDTFVTGELGWMERNVLLRSVHNDAFAAVTGGEWAKRFPDVDTRELMKQSNELGAGASMVGASNASYGEKLKLWAQHVGKLTHQLIQEVSGGNLAKLQPFIAKFQDNRSAGAELGTILTMLRRSSDKFVLATEGATTGGERLVIRELTIKDPDTGFRTVDQEKLVDWTARNPKGKAIFAIDSPDVLNFITQWRDINADRIGKRATLLNARGKSSNWDGDVIYAPPIDTQRYPYFAFVKIKEGHINGGSDVGMLTAKSAEELQKLKGSIDNDKYDVFLKADTEQYFKVKNEYDSQLSVNEPRVNSTLAKEGKLGDFFHEVRTENVLEDFTRYSQAADSALVRQAVDTKYAQLITELNALGNQYTKVATSQASGLFKMYDKAAVNPFGDYIKTALDISKRSAFPLLSQLNEFVDDLGVRAYRIMFANTEKARAGLISWQEAEKLATKYGIGGAYNEPDVALAFNVANRPMDRNIIKEATSKLNMFLSTAGLRLDFANSIINVISMPIMLGTELASLKGLAKSDPETLGALTHLFSTTPDGKTLVPSYTKLIGNAINNIMGKDGKQLIERYRATGDVKDVVSQFHDMMGELAIRPTVAPSAWSKKIDEWVEKGAKWSGSNFAEDFTRAVSANVMDQMTALLVERGLLTSKAAEAYRSVFVNRVNGNYIASQRPILFQGTVGGAVSLFQTYMFNVMQQMTRHIEDKNLRAIMTMTGLQGSIYGLNGLPFFEAVNTHLIGNAAINDGHRDIYSTTTQLANSLTGSKDIGEFMLYGAASALPLFSDKAPALYTRGDINPRHVTILPISPLDVPAVDVTRRMIANLVDIGSKLVQGADISETLLQGLEHNGVNRPMAGLAQVAMQHTTTSQGSLISASNEFSAIVTSARILGAKPMDESIALNAMFRMQAYKAADQQRLAELGEVVKTHLYNNRMPPPEDIDRFMKRYAAAGGSLQTYAGALQRWSKDANMSVVNQLKEYHNNQYAQRLTEIMGGTSLDDYRTPPPTQEPQVPQ